MHARVVLGVGGGVLFREVSSVQECPIERERFHCRHAMFCQFGHTDLHTPFTHTLTTCPHTLTHTQCTSLPGHILWVRLLAERDREKDTTRRPTKTRSQRIEKGSCVSEGDIERYIGTRSGV